MASATSASASAQFLPASYDSHADSSSLRLRMAAARATRAWALASADRAAHGPNASQAASKAASKSSVDPEGTVPISSSGLAGLRLSMRSSASAGSPPITIG